QQRGRVLGALQRVGGAPQPGADAPGDPPGAMRTTSGTSTAQSRGSRAGTPTRCAGRSWPAVRAHTSTGPGPSASCPFISRSRRGPATNFFDAIGNASPWELCRDRFGTDVRAAGRRRAGAPPAEARLSFEEANVIAPTHTRFRWLERGDGEPVLLLHGLMGEMDHWESTLDALGPYRRP